MTKRIIDGKTYNTETATCLAKEVFAPNGFGGEFDDLYQTRHGAYFRHHGNWGSTNHTGDVLEDIDPLTPPEAQKWMETHDFTLLLEKHFGEQPEAGEAESRITLRIPDVLKNQIEALALKNKQSLNAWIMRCVENCAAHQASSALAAE
jgi:hypothetical protein